MSLMTRLSLAITRRQDDKRRKIEYITKTHIYTYIKMWWAWCEKADVLIKSKTVSSTFSHRLTRCGLVAIEAWCGEPAWLDHVRCSGVVWFWLFDCMIWLFWVPTEETTDADAFQRFPRSAKISPKC